MSTIGLITGILIASFFTPLAALADARCVLAHLESLDSNRVKETLILANHLEINDGKERWFVSNDGTTKIQIKRVRSRTAQSELQVNVLVRDVVVMQTAGQSSGNFIGTQHSATLADGRSYSLTCVAQADR